MISWWNKWLRNTWYEIVNWKHILLGMPNQHINFEHLGVNTVYSNSEMFQNQYKWGFFIYLASYCKIENLPSEGFLNYVKSDAKGPFFELRNHYPWGNMKKYTRFLISNTFLQGSLLLLNFLMNWTSSVAYYIQTWSYRDMLYFVFLCSCLRLGLSIIRSIFHYDFQFHCN